MAQGKPVKWLEDHPRVHASLAPVAVSALLAGLLVLSECSPAPGDHRASEKPSETPSVALDLAGALACGELDKWLDGAEKPATRARVARRIDDLARDSKAGALADRSELLAKPGVIDSNENWALAVDALARECYVLGWAPLRPTPRR